MYVDSLTLLLLSYYTALVPDHLSVASGAGTVFVRGQWSCAALPNSRPESPARFYQHLRTSREAKHSPISHHVFHLLSSARSRAR
ncbi:hypothetical protein EDB81DRAFT_787231 [Dactylonectria macrodidyma]|uniref:Secreted protein n=1 Tax=Dactylonectria macrodidyma TaxID=307937 RepID=A0A9P9F9Y9_9HYPO|nr:hypothetical protein EDB81DRAFT_787231 [Dactylonectria macrodidyma]